MTTDFLHGVEVVENDSGLRPIKTLRSSVQLFVGTAPNADTDAFPMHKPVLIDGQKMGQKLGEAGSLPWVYDANATRGLKHCLVVRVPDDPDPLNALSHALGDASAQTGVYAALNAKNFTGLTPRLISAPGFTGLRPNDNANPVGAALKGVAKNLQAAAFVDGPDITEAAAIAARRDYGSKRVYMIDPAALVWDAKTSAPIARPASAFASIGAAKRDSDKGFWWSLSNQELSGIIGTSRPIGFGLGNPNTEANRLNEAGIGTIVHQDGFRLWGNRSTSDDPLWASLSVRRTADMIYAAIEAAQLWAMDRPICNQLRHDITESVSAYLRLLKKRGAILGGKVWLDPENNTEASLKAGQLYINFDIEPPAPMERLTFEARRNGDYYEEIFKPVERS